MCIAHNPSFGLGTIRRLSCSISKLLSGLPIQIKNAPIAANPPCCEEALRLGYEEAKKHTEEEPLLIRLTSTDDSTVRQQRNDGADGKRNTWNLRFGSEKGSFVISIKIENGNVITNRVRYDDNNLLRKGQFAISDINLDSPEAVREAIEGLGMQPGNPEIEDDWIKGYHFTIAGYLTDPNSSEIGF